MCSPMTEIIDAERFLRKLQEDIIVRLQDLVSSSGYHLEDTGFWRRLFQPTSARPPRGTEVLVRHLPTDVFEDELYRFFIAAGSIYDIRLMVRPSGVANRGFAFVRFFRSEDAQTAVRLLNKQKIRPHCPVSVFKSVENNRLFVSGVPANKSKVEIVNELRRNGVQGFTNVIMYRSMRSDLQNRGFVFVEFASHEEAAANRTVFLKQRPLFLWGRRVDVDWSKPMTDPNPHIMAMVRRIFVRNLPSSLSREEFCLILSKFLDMSTIEKIYKRNNYSFIHFYTRKIAESSMKKLKAYYCGTDVEVTWSIPPHEAVRKEKALPPSLFNRVAPSSVQNHLPIAGPSTPANQHRSSNANGHHKPSCMLRNSVGLGRGCIWKTPCNNVVQNRKVNGPMAETRRTYGWDSIAQNKVSNIGSKSSAQFMKFTRGEEANFLMEADVDNNDAIVSMNADVYNNFNGQLDFWNEENQFCCVGEENRNADDSGLEFPRNLADLIGVDLLNEIFNAPAHEMQDENEAARGGAFGDSPNDEFEFEGDEHIMNLIKGLQEFF